MERASTPRLSRVFDTISSACSTALDVAETSAVLIQLKAFPRNEPDCIVHDLQKDESGPEVEEGDTALQILKNFQPLLPSRGQWWSSKSWTAMARDGTSKEKTCALCGDLAKIALHECVSCGFHFCSHHSEFIPQVCRLLPINAVEPYACEDCAPTLMQIIDRELTIQRLDRLSQADAMRNRFASLVSTRTKKLRLRRPLALPENSCSCIDCGVQGQEHCEVCGLSICAQHCLRFPHAAGHQSPLCGRACSRCHEHAFARAAAHTAVRHFVAAAFRGTVSTMVMGSVLLRPEHASDCASCGLVFAMKPAWMPRNCGSCGLTLCQSCLCGRVGGCTAGVTCCSHYGRLSEKDSELSYICWRCYDMVQTRKEAEKILQQINAKAVQRADRCCKVLCFMQDQSQVPLFEQSYVDRAKDKACRVGDFALQGACQVAAVGIGTPGWLAYASQAANMLWEHGWYVIFGLLSGEELREAMETLQTLASTLPNVDPGDLITGSFYLSSIHRKMLREAPRNAAEEILSHGGKPVPFESLEAFLFIASLGLHIPYETDAFEVQRLALQQHWRLVDHSLNPSPLRGKRPGGSWKPQLSWCLFMHQQHDIAVFAVRGTEIQSSCGSDLLINADALPERLEGSDGACLLAHRGMLAATRALEAELRDAFQALARAGRQIIFTGHSLGGAVASILVWLLHYGSHGEMLPKGAKCNGIGYGVPSVMGRAASVALQPHFTSVINGLDVVARLTTASVGRLSREINTCARRSSEDVETDAKCFQERLLKFWEPRVRSEVAPMVTREGKPLTQMTLRGQMLQFGDDGARQARELNCQRGAKTEKRKKTSGKKISQHDELFIPGQVVWIHRVDGHLEAAVVPCDLPSLRRIVLDKRMMSDHTKVSMHQALLSVHMRQQSPSACRIEKQWQSFTTAGDRCPCCSNLYDWMNTSRSRKQRWYAMTNCRMCGLVVCIGCATTRLALPGQPFLEPARVCDRCAWRVPGGKQNLDAAQLVNDVFGNGGINAVSSGASGA